ncbi:transposable element Tcb1 transposase [Trichonephila clavipes]|nr:transposable element Tcb1 transposase [Trichonephila clavipes]
MGSHSETMAAATLDTASQTALSSMAESMTDLGARMEDNAQPHVAGIVRSFLDTENVRLLPWPGRSPDFSPTVNVWSRLPSDWFVTIRQLLRLMICGIMLKLSEHLYLHMASNLNLTQCPGI